MPTSKPRKMLSPSLVWATQDVSVTHQGKENAKTKSGPRQQERKVTDTQGVATSLMCLWNFPRLLLRTSLWLSSKDSACNAGDMGSILVLGRSSGEGNGNSLQYSCLGNPMDRGAWKSTVYRVTKSQIQLSDSATTATTSQKV